jgi:FdhD protein
LEVVSVEGARHPENVVEASLGPEAAFSRQRHVRSFDATSACGVCGKASLESVEARSRFGRVAAGFAVSASVLHGLAGALRSHQAVFSRTGGLHAAALVDASGGFEVVREDVGRHNAVDKVVGWAFLRGGVPLRDRALVVSGRAGFEIVQKAVAAGVPLVVAVGAPSSLAVEAAQGFGVGLVGFLGSEGFNVYSEASRVGP